MFLKLEALWLLKPIEETCKKGQPNHTVTPLGFLPLEPPNAHNANLLNSIEIH